MRPTKGFTADIIASCVTCSVRHKKQRSSRFHCINVTLIFTNLNSTVVLIPQHCLAVAATNVFSALTLLAGQLEGHLVILVSRLLL